MRKPTACWQLPGDPMATYGMRIGNAFMIRGHPSVWYYQGDLIATSVLAEVPRFEYIPDRFIPALRRVLHKK